MRHHLVVIALPWLLGACSYITAKVTIAGQANPAGAESPSSGNIPKGTPASLSGVIENRGQKDVLLDSRNFTWTPGQPGQAFDFKVKKGSTLVRVLKYPNGPTARATSEVPQNPASKEWPYPVTIDPVDLVSEQTASVEFFNSIATNMSLSDSGGTSPPSTTYEEVAKLMGAIVIVRKDWKPEDGILNKYEASIPVSKANKPPTSGVGIQRKINILNAAAVSASLSVPIYGSLSGSLTANQIYRLNFDLTHTSILAIDTNIWPYLLDTTNQDGNLAMPVLEYFAKLYPDAQVIVLRAVKYVVHGTIGITQGKSYESNFDAAVASAFTTKAGYRFNLDDEMYLPMTGAVTGWLWVKQEQPLSVIYNRLAEQRKLKRALPPDYSKLFRETPVVIKGR